MSSSIEALKEVLEYDAVSGNIYWRVSNSRRKVGDIAGTKSKNGYIYISYKYKLYLAHRVAWAFVYGEWPSCSLDHINRCKTDNRISNLRLCPNNQADNAQNQTVRSDSASGYTGVHYFKRTAQWTAYINVSKKRVNLGYFPTAEEANNARREAKRRLHTFQPEA